MNVYTLYVNPAFAAKSNKPLLINITIANDNFQCLNVALIVMALIAV